MKKRLFFPIILGSILLLAGCSSGSQKSGSSNYGAPAPSSPAQSQSAQPKETGTGNMVTIQNFAFSPATLTIKAGTTVTWTNNDSATHTIKSNAFNSGNLTTGDKFQFTFSNPGTYAYSCGIHPSMQGTIIVQ